MSAVQTPQKVLLYLQFIALACRDCCLSCLPLLIADRSGGLWAGNWPIKMVCAMTSSFPSPLLPTSPTSTPFLLPVINIGSNNQAVTIHDGIFHCA